MISLDTLNPDTTIQTWAARMNVLQEDIEEAVWVVGFDEDAVREYFANRRRVFIPSFIPSAESELFPQVETQEQQAAYRLA